MTRVVTLDMMCLLWRVIETAPVRIKGGIDEVEDNPLVKRGPQLELHNSNY